MRAKNEPLNRRKWRTSVACIAAAVTALAGVGLMVESRQFAQSDRIAANVTIAGVPVGGKTRSEATDVVAAALLPKLRRPLSLTDGSRTWEVTPTKLGGSLDVDGAVGRAYAIGRSGSSVGRLAERCRLLRRPSDVPVATVVDRAKLNAWLEHLAGEVDRAPRNATLSVVDGSVRIRPGASGAALQIDPTRDAVLVALDDPRAAGVALVTETQPPDVSATDLEGFRTVLSQCATRFRPQQRGRSHNLRLGAKTLSGAIIRPGEVLSVNERIGPRLARLGYQKGPAFVNGEIVPETGGGVCQIATTLYDAALLANLDIIQRRHHSMPVKYVPPGLDATLYYGAIDLRIRNPLRHAVMVLADASRDTLRVHILGDASDKFDVKLLRTGLETIPHAEKVIEDPELAPGERVVDKEGRDGYRVTVRRIVRRKGEVVREQRLHKDTYRRRDAVVRVGPAPDELRPAQLSFRPADEDAIPATPVVR